MNLDVYIAGWVGIFISPILTFTGYGNAIYWGTLNFARIIGDIAGLVTVIGELTANYPLHVPNLWEG